MTSPHKQCTHPGCNDRRQYRITYRLQGEPTHYIHTKEVCGHHKNQTPHITATRIRTNNK